MVCKTLSLSLIANLDQISVEDGAQKPGGGEGSNEWLLTLNGTLRKCARVPLYYCIVLLRSAVVLLEGLLDKDAEGGVDSLPAGRALAGIAECLHADEIGALSAEGVAAGDERELGWSIETD